MGVQVRLGGRYRLVERLGSGGMSSVWRGYDEILRRQVAVKVLSPEYATNAGLRAGLYREAKAAAALSHPHIAGVYDYGESESDEAHPLPFVGMELVAGVSLARRLDDGGVLPWPEAAVVCAQVASAPAEAHAHGVVHRDVKPGNLMLTSAGAKVVDFGISALAACETTVAATAPTPLPTPSTKQKQKREDTARPPAQTRHQHGMTPCPSTRQTASLRSSVTAAPVDQSIATPPADDPRGRAGRCRRFHQPRVRQATISRQTAKGNRKVGISDR